jgi:hypothetical protein
VTVAADTVTVCMVPVLAEPVVLPVLVKYP